jgi:hypothetical protein
VNGLNDQDSSCGGKPRGREKGRGSKHNVFADADEVISISWFFLTTTLFPLLESGWGEWRNEEYIYPFGCGEWFAVVGELR